MVNEHDDLALTLIELERLEAERKLRSIPAPLLETTWVLDAQVEAVVDALLIATATGDDRAYAHARHTGEWAARIAGELDFAPSAPFVRRCGVLADVDPAIVERVREVRECAPFVRAFQELRVGQGRAEVQTAALIIAVAEEFDSLIFACDEDDRYSPGDALRMMRNCADDHTTPIVQALLRAIRNAPADLVEHAHVA